MHTKPVGAGFSREETIHGWLEEWAAFGDDIRAAIGRPSERGPGLRVAVLHLAEVLTGRGWGPAVLALDGMAEVAVGSGGGPRLEGDPHRFVMVATGRADPASSVSTRP